MDYINLFITPAFTAGFFLIDLSTKAGGLYYNHQVPLKENKLYLYLLLQIGVGLVFCLLYYSGVKVFKSDPADVAKSYISNYTPVTVVQIIKGIVIAWFAHGVCTAKAIPGLHATIDHSIQEQFFRSFWHDLLTESQMGKLIKARKIIAKYNSKNESPLTLEVFGKKFVTYVLNQERLKTHKEIASFRALAKDVADASSVEFAIVYVLNKELTPTDVKSILYYSV